MFGIRRLAVLPAIVVGLVLSGGVFDSATAGVDRPARQPLTITISPERGQINDPSQTIPPAEAAASGRVRSTGVTVVGIVVGPAPAGAKAVKRRTAAGSSGLAQTGSATASFIGLGVVLLVSGAVVLAAARRGRRSSR